MKALRIIAGILLLLLSLPLFGFNFHPVEIKIFNLAETKIAIGLQNFKDYSAKHPVSEENAPDYNQQMLDLKNAVNAYKQTMDENTTIMLILNNGHIILGLLFLTAAIVLFTNFYEALMPLMVVLLAGTLGYIVVFYMHAQAFIDFIYAASKAMYKIQSILGLYQGSPYEKAEMAREHAALMLNTGMAVAALMYVPLPLIYLIKGFTKNGP